MPTGKIQEVERSLRFICRQQQSLLFKDRFFFSFRRVTLPPPPPQGIRLPSNAESSNRAGCRRHYFLSQLLGGIGTAYPCSYQLVTLLSKALDIAPAIHVFNIYY